MNWHHTLTVAVQAFDARDRVELWIGELALSVELVHGEPLARATLTADGEDVERLHVHPQSLEATLKRARRILRANGPWIYWEIVDEAIRRVLIAKW